MLKNSNVIITGARGGIGSAIVKKVAENGGNIWACAREEDPSFVEQIKKISDVNKVWIDPVYFDMSDEQQIKKAIKSITSKKCKIDVLINAAGVVYNGMFTMTPLNKLRDVFEVNFFNQIFIMQLISRVMMRQKSGVIVNVASVSGIETTEGKLAYGSSKAAMIYATKAISKELAQYNIRVNAIAPGLTDTKLNSSISEENLNKVLDRTSMHRMATPEEIANSVLYLASDLSSFMTGQVMIVDGGRMWS